MNWYRLTRMVGRHKEFWNGEEWTIKHEDAAYYPSVEAASDHVKDIIYVEEIEGPFSDKCIAWWRQGYSGEARKIA